MNQDTPDPDFTTCPQDILANIMREAGEAFNCAVKHPNPCPGLPRSKRRSPMPDRDITEALTGFKGLHVSDVSDGSLPMLARESGKNTKEGEYEEGQKVEQSGLSSVRSVRELGASPITDADFWNILATWPAAREHPRWRNNPGLLQAVDRLRKSRETWRPPTFNLRSKREPLNP